MEEDTLTKFVANMRASGQTDEMIADSLIRAGRNELVVMNALGIEHLSQLGGESHEPEPKPVEHLPSVLAVLDADGNPIIAGGNLPKAVGSDAEQPKPMAPKKHIDRTKPARTRVYPRPAQRSARPNPRPHLVEPEALTPEPTSVTPSPKPITAIKKPVSKPPANIPHDAKKYGHHTFDDFLNRVQSHKEIEAGEEYALPEGPHNDDNKRMTVTKHRNPSLQPLSANVNTDTHPPGRKPPQRQTDQINNVEELLEEQTAERKEEAKNGPVGPEMDDLLDEKDLRELKKTPSPTKAPRAVDLTTVPDTPKIANVGSTIHEIKSNNGVKIVVLLIMLAVLIGLAATVGLSVGIF